MFCGYKDEENLVLNTSFLEEAKIKNCKVPISNLNGEVDLLMIKNCLQEIKTNEYVYHSISCLCENIQKNPIKVLERFQTEDYINFFGSLIYIDTQESVLKSICIILQLISMFDLLYDQEKKEFLIHLIQKLPLYSHLKKLIKDSSKPSIQKLAIWCAISSLKLGQITRFINSILKTKGGILLSEYLRFQFMKEASKYGYDMDDETITKISTFVGDSIRSIDYDQSNDDHGFAYREQKLTEKLIISQCLKTLNNLFSSSFIPFVIIEHNKLLPKISSFLLDPQERKLRFAAAHILHSLIQSTQLSTEIILEISLFFNLFSTAQFGDEKLLNMAVKILEIPFSESDVYDVEKLIDSICDFDFQKYSTVQYKIKIEYLNILGFIVPFCNDEQIGRMFTPGNVSFLCDMILVGDPSIASDVSRLFYNALEIQRDLGFLEMVKTIVDDSTALDTLKSIVTDPDINKFDVDQIAVYLNEYWPITE